MSSLASIQEDLTVNIAIESHVKAPLDATFEALLEQMGPGFATFDGTSLHLKLEPRPGGRWYRDLGGDNGHFWGHVQAIKRPALLEITGPLFMSTAVVNNVQYRLAAADGGTLIAFRHTAFGFVPAAAREGMVKGWNHMLEAIRERAEAALAPAQA